MGKVGFSLPRFGFLPDRGFFVQTVSTFPSFLSVSKQFIETIVEIDKTYIGGKPRKTNGKDNDDDMLNNNTTNKRGRGTSKTTVIGVVDRINKKIIARVAMPNSAGQKLTGIQLLKVLSEVSKQENNNVVITDEFRAYNILDKRNFVRFKIDHTKMFSDGDIYTNNIESFWSVLKRGIYGIYHHISVKHMQKYVDEFCFRYSNRDRNMFDMVLRQSVLNPY